jgi:hypothetical protein
MVSCVVLLNSGSGVSSATSRVPPLPPLCSLVLAPDLGLGSRGWDAGAGPSNPVQQRWSGTMGPWLTQRNRFERCPWTPPRARRGEWRMCPSARPPADWVSGGGLDHRMCVSTRRCYHLCHQSHCTKFFKTLRSATSTTSSMLVRERNLHVWSGMLPKL